MLLKKTLIIQFSQFSIYKECIIQLKIDKLNIDALNIRLRAGQRLRGVKKNRSVETTDLLTY